MQYCSYSNTYYYSTLVNCNSFYGDLVKQANKTIGFINGTVTNVTDVLIGLANKTIGNINGTVINATDKFKDTVNKTIKSINGTVVTLTTYASPKYCRASSTYYSSLLYVCLDGVIDIVNNVTNDTSI
jgi:hypothetical protein